MRPSHCTKREKATKRHIFFLWLINPLKSEEQLLSISVFLLIFDRN